MFHSLLVYGAEPIRIQQHKLTVNNDETETSEFGNVSDTTVTETV